jgi:hypothetical protein
VEHNQPKLDQENPQSPNAELLAHLNEKLDFQERDNPVYHWLERSSIDDAATDIHPAIQAFSMYLARHDRDVTIQHATADTDNPYAHQVISEGELTMLKTRFKDHPGRATGNRLWSDTDRLYAAGKALETALDELGYSDPHPVSALFDKQLSAYLTTAYEAAAMIHQEGKVGVEENSSTPANPFTDRELLHAATSYFLQRKKEDGPEAA